MTSVKYSYIILVIGLIMTTLFSNCKKQADKEEVDTFLINYLKINSWVDYTYQVSIDQDGNLKIIEIYGISNQQKESEYQLSANDLHEVAEKLNQLEKRDIKDSYGFNNDDSPTDLPIKSLSYITSKKSDSTSIYFPEEDEVPIELSQLIQKIEQILSNIDELQLN